MLNCCVLKAEIWKHCWEYLAADGVADGVEIPWEQTELFKDSQRNYDYLENIYQWEATCGSDANDTEASYHPYDDDYEAGTSEYRDAVYCTTHVLEESDQTGALLYNIDEENGITRSGCMIRMECARRTYGYLSLQR